MFARSSFALGTVCAALAAHVVLAPAAPAEQQPGGAPAKPPFRVHNDPGYHVGRVEYLKFRKNDTELVSVGNDRSVRVWDVKNLDKPRAERAFFCPDVPSAACLNPNKGERYLACGFYRRDGADDVSVRVIDLDGARPDGVAPHHEVKIPAPVGGKFRVITGLHFDHTGEHLIITGAAGELWHWHGVDWSRPKGEPRRVAVAPMVGYTMNAVTFHSKRQLVVAAGAREENGKGKQHICVAPFDGEKLGQWDALDLPGNEPYVYSMDWHAEYGLAVGYYTREPNKLARARVVVYPPKGIWVGEPLGADLGVGFTTRVAWAPGGALVATLGQDGYNPLPPEFLKVDQGRLVRVPRDDVFPGLDREAVRKASGAGLSACTAGTNTEPLSLAWADYAQGRIELARVTKGKGVLAALDRRQSDNWYTRLSWSADAEELVLESPTGRKLALHEPGLWAEVGLPRAGEVAGKTEHNPFSAHVDANPLVCAAKFGEKRSVLCFNDQLKVAYWEQKHTSDDVSLPGIRSVLAFEKSQSIVTLESSGGLSFWKYRPDQKGKGPLALERKGAAILKGDGLAYSTPKGASHNWEQKPVIARDDLEQTLARVYPKSGANDPEPAHVISGLDTDVVLPAGLHTFQVRVPHPGELHVQVINSDRRPRSVFEPQKVGAGTTTVARCALTPTDRTVTVTLLPNGGTAGVTTTHSIQVGDIGKIVLFDVTPQQGKLCTELPEPKAPPVVPFTPTADKLATVLKKLSGGQVVRHTAVAAPAPKMPVTATAAQVDEALDALLAKPTAVGPNDCFVLLLKGHGELYPEAKPEHMYFKTDGFNQKIADTGGDTGISPKKLAALLERVSTRTKKVVVILDCCNAELFLDTLYARPISFYPCSLRGNKAEAEVLPQALERLMTRIQKGEFPVKPGELVTQSDFLQAIRDECFGYVNVRKGGPADWGYGAVRDRFVIAHIPR